MELTLTIFRHIVQDAGVPCKIIDRKAVKFSLEYILDSFRERFVFSWNSGEGV